MKFLPALIVSAFIVTSSLVACGDDSSSAFPDAVGDLPSSSAKSDDAPASSAALSSSSSAKSSSSVKSSSSSVKSSSSSELSSSSFPEMPCNVEGGISYSGKWGDLICKDGFLEPYTRPSSSSSSFPELLCDEEDEGITSWMSGLGDLICKDGYYVPYTRPSSSSQAIPTFKESFEVDSVFASVDKEKEYGLFTDPRDGQVYKTVVVKTSYVSVPEFEVFVQNLNYGTQIKLETTDFDDNKVEKYCYDDDPWYCDTYFGGLYSWSEAMGLPKACDSVLTGSTPDCPEPLAMGQESQLDSMIVIHQGICPDGWHVMNEREWRAMIAGEETCTNVVSKAFGGINATGFSALYGGCYDLQSNAYASIETWGYFWTPREFSETVGGGERLDAYHYEYIHGLMFLKGNAVSVRCVKDY